MNTPQDRANRIMAWGTRGRDLLWIMTMVLISHVLTLSLIGAGFEASFIPLSIFLVFFSILGIMGSLDAMDDIAAVAEDADEEENPDCEAGRYGSVLVKIEIVLVKMKGTDPLEDGKEKRNNITRCFISA